jgi:hypothetical protein
MVPSMAKRVTISVVYDALLQLAGDVEEYTRKNDARWDADDARWNENALLLSGLQRRVTNVEIEVMDFRTETRESFARIERRLDAVETGK